MSQALQPILRPTSLSSVLSTKTSTTYICQACRDARLLKRPKRPYTFTQLVTLSDGSAFTMRTTSPIPVFRSSRDTRNSPLWNPSSRELANQEDDDSGRLSGFRARFGRSFDASRDDAVDEGSAESAEPTETTATPAEPEKATSAKKTAKPKVQEIDADDLDAMFANEDDAQMLEMISNFGKEDKGKNSQIAKKKI